jgi:hypothetical protein
MPRPRLRAQDRRTKVVSVALTEQEYRAVAWAGRKARLKPSLVLREKSVAQALDEYLNRRQQAA